MKVTQKILLIPSPCGLIALTSDQLRDAKALANDFLPDDPAANVELDDASCAERRSLVDAREVARLFGVPPSWVLQRARERRIPYYRVGKYVRFDPDEVREFFAQMPDRPADSIETSLL